MNGYWIRTDNKKKFDKFEDVRKDYRRALEDDFDIGNTYYRDEFDKWLDKNYLLDSLWSALAYEGYVVEDIQDKFHEWYINDRTELRGDWTGEDVQTEFDFAYKWIDTGIMVACGDCGVYIPDDALRTVADLKESGDNSVLTVKICGFCPHCKSRVEVLTKFASTGYAVDGGTMTRFFESENNKGKEE